MKSQAFFFFFALKNKNYIYPLTLLSGVYRESKNNCRIAGGIIEHSSKIANKFLSFEIRRRVFNHQTNDLVA